MALTKQNEAKRREAEIEEERQRGLLGVQFSTKLKGSPSKQASAAVTLALQGEERRTGNVLLFLFLVSPHSVFF